MQPLRWSGLRAFVVLFAGAIACGEDVPVTRSSIDASPNSDAGPVDSGLVDAGPVDAEPVDATLSPTRAEFGLDQRLSNTTCKAPPRPPVDGPIKIEQVYETLSMLFPMVAAQRPNDGSRWYIAHRRGELTYFSAQNPTPSALTEAMNLATLAGPGLLVWGEGGFLGFAFHPKFAQNGKAYVSFTAPPTIGSTASMRSVIAEITSTDGGDTFTGYKTILSFDQTPQFNHKGGGLAFDREGLLYASFGDGNDPYNNGQSTDGFFSKVIRIDVDRPGGGREYGIPPDNPFVNGGGEPATFAYGFRNPFRLSIDRQTNNVWVGDVGQLLWEEIDQVKLGGNYGWPCREGKHDYSPEKCPGASLAEPLVEHYHAEAYSIIGGVVYRGKAMPALVGSYIYGDYITSKLFVLSFDLGTGEPKSNEVPGIIGGTWVGFAEDVDGEVYGLSLQDGKMFKVVPTTPQTASLFPDRLSKTGCVDTSDPKLPALGLVPYSVNAELWSDGADKERFIAVPEGQTIVVGGDGDFDLPIGSVAMKTFMLGGKRIETRLLVRHDDGGWAGYSYEWLDDQSDAILLPTGKTKSVGAQSWSFPSRGDCARCHTDAAGKTLGLELGQLNGDFTYRTTNRIANQLRTLEHIGLLSSPLGKPVDRIVKYPAPQGPGPLEARARAYLHANCSQCHREGGPGRGNWDARFALPFDATKLCNGTPEAGDLGIAGAMLLAPGAPEKSLISLRAHALNANRMPPVASNVVDADRLSVVDDWIRSVPSCP